MRSIALVLSLLACAAAFAEDPPKEPPKTPSNVTLPLSDYEELQKLKAAASATVIDTMALAGTFREKNLTVTFTGKSVGSRAATPIVSDATDVTFSGCSGDALILRAGKGAFQLVALAPSFTVRCDVRLSGSDRLRMNVQPPVLAVRSAVSDGELLADDEATDGSRVYTLVRQVVGVNETLATTATGRYLITLLPDATRFRYAIQVHNPNRNTSPLPLKLMSNEHLQQIDSSAPYEVKDGDYIFAMPPGDSTITLTGELPGTTFAPPVAASLQYLVIESHPLLRPAIAATPKRVSIGETGITTQYRGALAYEIGPRERLTWSVARLEAMRAISYAVHSATHTLFVPATGPILGESSFLLENQGAAEIVLPPKPEPTFVSLQGEPVLMTKNAAGQLTIPLSVGNQNVTVQHRQEASHFGVMVARLDVPMVPIPATVTQVQLRYPEHWLPLWQSFATEATVWHPDVAEFLAFVLIAVWIERVLAFLGVALRRRAIVAAVFAFAASLIPPVLWILVVSCGFVTVTWLVANRAKWSIWRVVGAIAVAVIVFLIAFVYVASKRMTSSDSSGYGLAMTSTAREEPAQEIDAARVGKGVVGYQGLPARFELPSGVRFGHFSQQLLATDQPQRVTIILLSMTIVTWLAIALSLYAAWLLWRERAAIRAALTAAMPAPPTPHVAET